MNTSDHFFNEVIRSRIAPTPSGFLHAGNVFNFLYTHFITKRLGGELGLRIDDHDSARTKDIYIHDIFDTLEWLNLKCDFGPKNFSDFKTNYSQQLFKNYYFEFLNAENSNLFYCGCSRKKILSNSVDNKHHGVCSLLKPSSSLTHNAIRCSIPAGTHVSLGDKSYSLYDSSGDFVVWTKENEPAYHFMNIIEDVKKEITLIVRGEDLEESTAIQIYLSSVLDFPSFKNICFIFHPLFLTSSGEKLSKSKGAGSLRDFRERGGSVKEFKEELVETIKNKNFSKLPYFNDFLVYLSDSLKYP